MIHSNNPNPIRFLIFVLVEVTLEKTRSTVALLIGKLYNINANDANFEISSKEKLFEESLIVMSYDQKISLVFGIAPEK